MYFAAAGHVPRAFDPTFRSRRGMGDSCPSVEQLAGITDCTDPCQAPYGACAASVPGIPALPVGSPSTNYSLMLPQALVPSAGSAPAASYMPLILAGALVIGLTFLVASR